MRKRKYLLFIGLVAVLVCFLTAEAKAESFKKTLSFSNMLIKLGPPGRYNAAAYSDIYNNLDIACILESVKSNDVKKIEIHSAKMESGMMTMRRESEVSLPPNYLTKLAPMGMHLMLIGVDESLWEKENVIINFVTRDCGSFSVAFQVEG